MAARSVPKVRVPGPLSLPAFAGPPGVAVVSVSVLQPTPKSLIGRRVLYLLRDDGLLVQSCVLIRGRPRAQTLRPSSDVEGCQGAWPHLSMRYPVGVARL